jgi:hypothetical protein
VTNTPEATDRLVERLRKFRPYMLDGEWFTPPLCIEAADEITALKAEIARLREALDEAVICLSWIASLGYEGAPDIAMRKAAMASLAKINAALRQPQAGGHDER